LEYSIDEEAEIAMRNEDISEALKLKISKERVGTELEKMLRGKSTSETVYVFPCFLMAAEICLRAPSSSRASIH
jgi:hypothetical protein